jgi:hypothetical protein
MRSIVGFVSICAFYAPTAFASQSCTFTHYTNKPDLGLSGAVVVSKDAGGGISIVGSMTSAPTGITGNVVIGTDTNCDTECVELDDVHLGNHASECLGGKSLVSKKIWKSST